jgi:hypothetical protein
MTTASETSPIFAWDGQSHLAFAMGGGDAILALFAHGGASPSLIAVWEASAGPCIVALPAGCRHGELQILHGGLVTETVAIELDDLLLPDLIAADLDGVRRVRFEKRPDGFLLDTSGAVDGSAGPGCLNLMLAGVPSFSRCRVGPLFDPQAGGRRIGVEAADGPDGSVVLNLGPGQAASMLLAAHVVDRAKALRQQIDSAEEMPVILAGALASLAAQFPVEADASGADATEAMQRGFRMLAPAGGKDAASLSIAGWRSDDELIVFAPRGFQVVWRGEGGGAPGSRLFLSRGDGGPWSTRVVSTAYRPATSTAMAALGGGGVAQHQGGKVASASEADLAADLASAIWPARVRPPERCPRWRA